MINILHVNAFDVQGGAARAAYRIHRSLVSHGEALRLQSRLRAIHKTSFDPTVIGGPPALASQSLWRRLRPNLERLALRGFHSANYSLQSVAWPATGLGRELATTRRRQGADLLHLHWIGDHRNVGGATLSIEEIGRLPQPLVWTLHDQWAFCGAEHYTGLRCNERFVAGYTPSSRPSLERGPDVNRSTWLRKHRAWRRPIQIVCPSEWMADCARRSALMASWPISVIPYPIELNIWAPVDQQQARALLQLPLDRPLVLFGALYGTADPRKGADLLFSALEQLRPQLAGTELAQLEVVVYGQSPPADPLPLGFPVHYSGHINNDLHLRLLYAAADLFVIPSRQDNLPNTGLEAQACGSPVVAFRNGGLVDIVADRVTGALAEPFDPVSLAAAIRWVLEDPQRRRQLAAAARQRAERLWDPERIMRLYADIYHQALDRAEA